MSSHPPLIALLGPTAVGKTDLSLGLCERFNGEVVSADSRLIYRGMDIGTAKPSAEEQARVPHHLIDIATPDETLTLAQYQEQAYAVIDAIHARGKVPFLVGGSALYVRGVVEGLRIPEVPPNEALRAELETFLAEHGRDALFARLQALDPLTAGQIDGKNHRRVIRALEIFLETGQPKVMLEGTNPPSYRILQMGLDRNRAMLYERIDRRVEQMMAEGLIAEAQQLLNAGFDSSLPALSGLGYREVFAHLRGEMTLPEAVERIQTETHRFVRHQYTWFRRMKSVRWFDLGKVDEAEIFEAVARFLDDPKTTQSELK